MCFQFYDLISKGKNVNYYRKNKPNKKTVINFDALEKKLKGWKKNSYFRYFFSFLKLTPNQNRNILALF